MFSDRTLTEIRERTDIVEIVGQYVQLKKSGQGFTGLCPFHNEKGPSFHVHPMKRIFHCFGCQKSGNVFTFLMLIEGVPFPEAVERLARKTGVTIEKEERRRARPERQVTPDEERCLAALEWAARYFHFNLTEGKEFQFARDYVKSRGLTEASIKKFQIGVAPKGWDTLQGLMKKRGYQFADLLAAGLVARRENGPQDQGYDRFRNRLMFPILNTEGKVVGFGARALAPDDTPKYLNSAETPVFQKSRILYGLHENQRGIRLKGEAVIVEGYMDVVGLSESGVDNAVAGMGTAFTEDQARLIRQLTRRVVTVFDADAAGTEASRRSISLFLQTGIFAKDITLPDGLDPDEYALKYGKDSFYELCEKAPRQVTKLLKEIASRGPLSEEATTKLVGELTPLLVASRSLPDRALLWDDISLVLKVSVQTLRAMAESAYQPSQPAAKTERPAVAKASPKKPPFDALDKLFVEAALREPQLFREAPSAEWAPGIKTPAVLAWLLKLHASDEEGWSRCLEELVHGGVEEALTSLATAALMGGLVKRKEDPPFSALAKRVSERKRELEIKTLAAQVRLSERLGEEAELLPLLSRLEELRSPD